MKITTLILAGVLSVASYAADTNVSYVVGFDPVPTRPLQRADIEAFLQAGGATNGLTVAQRDREIVRWQRTALVSNGVVYVQSGWRCSFTNNPDYARYWWVASMGDRYGFTLPVSPDVAAGQIVSNAVAALAASNTVTAGYIQLDGSVASYIFSARTLEAIANGQPEADWSRVPPALVVVRTPVYRRLAQP